jgi:hypothetical protein
LTQTQSSFGNTHSVFSHSKKTNNRSEYGSY